MNLKAHLAFLVAEADRRRAEDAEAELRQAEAAQLRMRREAEALFAGIPDAAADALAEGRTSISLYEDASVAATVEGLTGVAGHLRDLVTEGGLGDHLYVDVDCSGDYAVKNDLRLSLREPAKRR
jgi:hypothetical protein